MALEWVEINDAILEVHYFYKKGIPGWFDAEFQNSFEEELEEFYINHVYHCGYDFVDMLDMGTLEAIQKIILERIGE